MVLFVLIGVGKALVWDLEIRFRAHGVMNVLGIVYPQFWVQPKCDATFVKHLQVINQFFAWAKPIRGMTKIWWWVNYSMLVTVIANKAYSSSQWNKMQQHVWHLLLTWIP
jgi:hypothetical protein